jgi:hypothetical protein
MKTIRASRRIDYLAIFGIFLVTAALIAGTAGCGPGSYPPCPTPLPSQNLEIRDWYDFAAVSSNLSGNHTLVNDLDSTTPGYEGLAGPRANQRTGWQPIGTFVPMCPYAGFSGTFDGQGHEIRDVYINRPDDDLVGLSGCVYEEGVVRNVGVTNVTVIGDWGVGGPVGRNLGSVSNSYSVCGVNGKSDVGGLVGDNYEGTVSDSFWDIGTSGQSTSDGGTGKTTSEMKTMATFSSAGWNIIAVAPGERDPSYIWSIVDGVTYPFLS